MEDKVKNEFCRQWHSSGDGTWHKTRWLGVKILKNPCDLMVYQELITSLKPAWIIETGTCFGGSALFLATICQALGKGHVLSVDIKPPKAPVKHPRIEFITGSSIDTLIIEKIRRKLRTRKGHVLVILDSNHKKDHVYRELELYSQFVTKSSYLIVEDTNINRLVLPEHGPGPAEAVEAWLPTQKRFVVDRDCERYHLTFNSGGYLKCLS